MQSSTPNSNKPEYSSCVSKESVTTFRNKLYGTIDVWWLYDDGGRYSYAKW